MTGRGWFGTVVVTGFLAAGVALATSEHDEHAAAEHAGTEHGGGAKGDVTKEVAEYVLHHVADSDEYHFESPLPFLGHGFAIDVGGWFAGLRIEGKPGACSQPIPPAMSAFPSLAEFSAGCYDLRPTKAILMMWLATALLALVLFMGRNRDSNGVPKGLFAHVVETLVLFVRDEIAVPNIGKAEAGRYTPYLASLFFFVLFTNWLGLVPGFFTGTGVLAVTAALSIITFVLTQIAGMRSAGVGGYFSHLFGDVPLAMKPLMFIVEFLGLFTKPFALLIRLFANMLGGHMVIMFLLSLIIMLHWGAFVVSVPMAMAMYVLEIFVGILQAYLFTLLTSLFIGQGVALGHHGHDHADEAHH